MRKARKKETATEYVYDLSEGDETLVENLIFEEGVTVNGNSNKGNVINTGNAKKIPICKSNYRAGCAPGDAENISLSEDLKMIPDGRVF